MQTFPIQIYRNIFATADEYRIFFPTLDILQSMNLSSQIVLDLDLGELEITKKLPQLLGSYKEPVNHEYLYFVTHDDVTRMNQYEPLPDNNLSFFPGSMKSDTIIIHNAIILFQRKLREAFPVNYKVSSIA